MEENFEFSTESQGIHGNSFVVTGGLGFVGHALCLELLRLGARRVRSFDIRSSSPWSNELLSRGVICTRGDITEKKDVERAVERADCVFHLVAYGISGKEMLQVDRVKDININGTRNVVEACLKHKVGRLVYVSTNNVVFEGDEIIDGDEALPYTTLEFNQDAYSCSKSGAERLVLRGNGRLFKNNNTSTNRKKNVSKKRLYTCAIRPPGIYGPGEEKHLPRLVFLAKWGFLLFKLGEPNVITDWIYVDNLVHALILASKGLSADRPGKLGNPIASGQAYFVSDGSPVNTYVFLRPLLQSLDYDMPTFRLPVSCALFLGKMYKKVYMLLHPWSTLKWFPLPLMLLPSEIPKVTVTHYFSTSKAERELGYVPKVSPPEGMAATIEHWQAIKRESLDGPGFFTWLFVSTVVTALFAAALSPNVERWLLLHLGAITRFIMSGLTVRRLLMFAMVERVWGAIFAWFLAEIIDPFNSKGWFRQTLALGFISVYFLLKRL